MAEGRFLNAANGGGFWCENKYQNSTASFARFLVLLPVTRIVSVRQPQKMLSHPYFIDGITIPLRMIFWQERKTIMVGIEMMTKPALTTQGIPRHHCDA